MAMSFTTEKAPTRIKKSQIALLLAVAISGTTIFMTPLCGFLFQCGCVWNWTGGSSQCNIHHSTGPHCPWCASGIMGSMAATAGLVLGQFMGGFLTLRLGGRMVFSSLMTIVSVVPAGLLVGYLTILLTSYPYFVTHP
jgi:hypothetical protein